MRLGPGCSDNSLLNRNIVIAWKGILHNETLFEIKEIPDEEAKGYTNAICHFITSSEYGIFTVGKTRECAVQRIKKHLKKKLEDAKDKVSTIEFLISRIEKL